MVAKRHLVPWIGCLLVPLMILVAVLAVCERSVHAAEIKIDRPKDREFVRDLAGMIDADKGLYAMRRIIARLEAEQAEQAKRAESHDT